MKKEKRPHDDLTCGAKTRAGTPCKQKAGWGTDHVGEGRCKLHGGKSTGVKGNKNAVVTHEHESIIFDFLDDEEKELLKQIDLDKIKQIDNDIKLIDIRLRRMMGRIATLQEGDMSTVEVSLESGPMGDKMTEKKQGTLGQIQNIEDAITRVQGQKLKLIEAKHKLETSNGIDIEYKQVQIDKLKAQIEKIKGISDNIEDTSELRRILLNE